VKPRRLTRSSSRSHGSLGASQRSTPRRDRIGITDPGGLASVRQREGSAAAPCPTDACEGTIYPAMIPLRDSPARFAVPPRHRSARRVQDAE
jgi:hypothetical protein